MQDALATLPYDFGRAWLIRPPEAGRTDGSGVPLFDLDLEAALADLEQKYIVDLSDEPVLRAAAALSRSPTACSPRLPYVATSASTTELRRSTLAFDQHHRHRQADQQNGRHRHALRLFAQTRMS